MQSIRIQNLGPIKDATIELKGITILLGEQAAGKSTIAQCVHFFRSLTEDLAEAAFNLRRAAPVSEIEEAIKNTIRSKFYIYYGSSKFLDNFDIQFNYSAASWIRIKKGEKTEVELSPGFQIQRLCQAIKDSFDLTFFSSDRRADFLRRMMESHLLLLDAEKQDRFERDIYYPADRNIATMYSEQFRLLFLDTYRGSSLLSGKAAARSVHLELTQEIIQRSVVLKEKFEQRGGNFEVLLADGRLSQDFIRDFIDRCAGILKGKYIIASSGQEKIKIGQNRHIELGRASSGQQSVVRILQELAVLNADRNYAYRTIEEPEVHLFPSAQNQLTELMVMCHNLTASEFLLTTHSPYFVATFNNLLYASKAAQFDSSEVDRIGYRLHLRLPASNFAAYQVSAGSANSIYDAESGLIGIEGLDAVSLEIGGKFSQLVDIVQNQEAISE